MEKPETLFLLAFLAVTLFVFFWGEAYFARNIADVRPMFEWMPVLLVFLSAALTMRMWSEERRTGTLEFVATLPVSGWEFVLGKFLACWALLAVALLLTVAVAFDTCLANAGTLCAAGRLDSAGKWCCASTCTKKCGGGRQARGRHTQERTASNCNSE